MVDDSIHKNTQDTSEESFLRIEEKVVDISHNMSLLMVVITNNFGPFREVGGSNLKYVSYEKLRDSEGP
jgi:predicted neutral ceramidase superfamily lipid hydrolase